MQDYIKQAENFAQKHGIELKFIGSPDYGRHFQSDTQSRYIWKCKLSRNGEIYVFKFGQSINAKHAAPTMYDILACLQKYDVGSYDDFLGEFGYERGTESRKTYSAVCKEFEAVQRLFSDIIDELQEIS